MLLRIAASAAWLLAPSLARGEAPAAREAQSARPGGASADATPRPSEAPSDSEPPSPPTRPQAWTGPTAQAEADGGSGLAPTGSAEDDVGGPILILVRGSATVPVGSAREPTIASYAIEGPALREPGQSLADALARVPGVQTTRAGADADFATAAVRGASSAQTPVYLAGIRLNDELTGSVDLSTLPLWMIHRVEVFRGFSPDHADRDGIGGAIVLEPELPHETRLGAGVGAGSFGWRESHVGLSLGGPRAGAFLALRHEVTANDFDFIDDRGTRFDETDDRTAVRRNADAATTDVWSIGRVALGRSGSLTTLVNLFEREAGVPGTPMAPTPTTRARQTRTLAGVSARVPCGADAETSDRRCELELATSAMHTRYALDETERSGTVRSVSNDGRRLSERLHAKADVLDWLELDWGAGAEQELLAVDGRAVSSLHARRLAARLDAGARAHVAEALDLVLSTALECHSTEGPRPLEACAELQPLARLGARWRIVEPLSLFANVARSVRVPTLAELYGTSAVVAGNPELVAERGIGADVGAMLVHRDDGWSAYAQVVGFMRWASDLIAFHRSSFGVIRPFNVAAARILGLELAGGASLFGVFDVGITLTALDPRDTTEGRAVANDLLPLQSRLVLAPFVELGTPPWREAGIERAAIGARFGYRSSRVADPAGLVLLDEQKTLDLTGSLLLLEGAMALRCAASNLLDEQSVDLVGYPLPGRAGHVQLEAWW